MKSLFNFTGSQEKHQKEADYKLKISKANQKIKELEETCQNYKSSIDKNERFIKEKLDVISHLKDEKTIFSEKITSQYAKISKLNGKLEKVYGKNEILKKDVEKYKKDLKNDRKEFEAIRNANEIEKQILRL